MGMGLKLYASVAKGLKLKKTKNVLAAIPTLVEVTVVELVGRVLIVQYKFLIWERHFVNIWKLQIVSFPFIFHFLIFHLLYN